MKRGQMATHPTGKGTVNVAVNLLETERTILRRLAVEDGRSLSTFLRRQIVAGLRVTNPAAAIEIEKARKEHQDEV